MQDDRPNYRLGIDIGGTFTDFALLDESTGEISALKYPSNRTRPAAAVFAGWDRMLADQHVEAADLGYFTHGTTLAVNTVLQRNGAKTALLVTRGLRDILYIGRHRLPDIFNFFTEMPMPLVPRSLVVEVDERCLADGTILEPVDLEQVREAVRDLVGDGVEAIAVGFLHSYRNPAHEQAVRDVIAETAPEMFVSLSSTVWPQMREFERVLICVMNAYVGRKMEAYFYDLESGLAERGLEAPVLSTKSNGGVMTAREAGSRPVETLMSGPAAGAIGAAFVAKAAGFEKVITLDMGGTSTDVSIIDGEPRYSTENQVGNFPVIMPAVDVTSIGAGGGSIAWLDDHGVLKVGPQSAGADPGPACYGHGGQDPTLTDAYVCLGIIDPGEFAGGTVKIDSGLAEAAVGRLAKQMNVEPNEAAESILRIATSHIYAALVPLLARKGVSYEDFALLPFGGAGPTHGFLAARDLGITRVIVPPHPGILCATGALVADARRDFVRSIHKAFKPNEMATVVVAMREVFDDLVREGQAWLETQNLYYRGTSAIGMIDMRYLGQSFEIPVVIDRAVLDDESGEALRRAFYAEYQAIYGYADKDAELEVRDVRVAAIGTTPKPKLRQLNGARSGHQPNVRQKEIFHDGRMQVASFVERSELEPGFFLDGPAVVQQYDTTTFVPSGYRFTVDVFGTLIGEATHDGR
jgi:N-methylhydantoinase A